MTQMSAGWYPDPMSAGPARVVRYWDGTRWTQHVQAAPEPGPTASGPSDVADVAGGLPTAPYAATPTYPAATEPGSPAAPPGGPPGAEPPPYPTPFGTPPGAPPGAGGPYAGPGGYGTPYGAPPHGAPPHGAPAYGAPGYGPPGYGPAGYGSAYPGAPMAPWIDPRSATPDGQPLAGWGARLGAYLIDVVLVGIVTAALGFPWLRQVFSRYVDFGQETIDATEQGRPTPDTAQIVADVFPALVVVSLIGLGVNFVYHAGFLRWRAATPGKMALGLQVRLRDAPGRLSWSTIALRWVSQNVASILGLVPVLGTLASVYPLLDGLWPLWDGKRQALHDKVAKTNVVRTR